MGIPSYYSYLIKNHPDILEILLNPPQPDHFYLDANSIIYDIVNQSNDEIIKRVIQEIEKYILFVAPKKTVTIAFDGCAPRAKMQQQRERRFKSYYLNKAQSRIKKVSPKWNTANITPGTEFMKLLSEMMKSHFTQYNVLSDCSGEGEHKIFQIIRDNAKQDEVHLIYGLDSDLIMISMMHIELTNIYLFRETPQYIKQFHSSLDPKSNYLLNVSVLSRIIEKEMGGHIHDYVFISFLMGNDFMPHFPALNIRTGGIDKIINAYKLNQKQIVNIDRNTKEITIVWDHFFHFLQLLSDREEEFIQKEFLARSRKPRCTEPMQKIENLPLIDRKVELFINPMKDGWEKRYNETLGGNSKEYIDGLVWNITYYTFGCSDWNWNYSHHYPPLLKDLILKIPKNSQTIQYIESINENTDLEQLCTVLPKDSLYLVPEKIRRQLPLDWYVDDCCFTWAFCKYFWESHPDLPVIDISELKLICS
uniref:Xrn1 N-terminal domain-containing protein n=1 Tax=viral metagenome TaxID=1070528 RepID=A0A6C0HRC9_9ZZZZ